MKHLLDVGLFPFFVLELVKCNVDKPVHQGLKLTLAMHQMQEDQ